MHSILPRGLFNLRGMIRTPPSLNWLIGKRARLLGEIEKLKKSRPDRIASAEKELADAQIRLEQAKARLAYEQDVGNKIIEALRKDLNAIDCVLGLHEIKINPEIIQPIRSQNAKRLLPYGKLTRSIFDSLKQAGGGPLSTDEIVKFIIYSNGLYITAERVPEFREGVRQRLKTLCKKGTVERLHPVKCRVEGSWTLPQDVTKLIP